MRIQLESPKNSGRTSHRPPQEPRLPERARQEEDGDVLVEDVMMTAGGMFLSDDDDSEDEDDEMDEESDIAAEIEAVLSDPTRRVDNLSEIGITTSEDLVRRLKARENTSGTEVTKIEIAKRAFHDTVLHIPKKHRLIAEWLVESICKDTKDIEGDIKQDESITFHLNTETNRPKLKTHAEYWSLLALCVSGLEASDTAQLAKKYSLPHLLVSYYLMSTSVKWMGRDRLRNFFEQMSSFRNSRQSLGIDTLNRGLAMALTNLYSQLEHAEDVIEVKRMVKCFQQPDLVDTLNVLLSLWSSELSRAGNAEKTKQFFLSDLLFLFSIVALETSQAKRCCHAEKHQDILTKLQEQLQQIVYQCFFERGDINAECCKAILNRIESAGTEALPICSHFLSQMCEKLFNKSRKRKRTSTASSDISGNESTRLMVLEHFIIPATAIVAINDDIEEGDEDQAITLEKRVTCLREMLTCIDKYKLHQSSGNGDGCTKLLREMAEYAFAAIQDTTYLEDDETARAPSYRLLCSIHDLDSDILRGDLQSKAIASAWDILSQEEQEEHQEGTRRPDLIQALFSTANKQRRVPDLLNSYFDAMDGIIQFEVLRQSNDLQGAFFSDLYHPDYYQKTIGVAVQDFLSPQQALDVIDMTSIQLKEINSTYVSTKDKPVRSIEYDDNIRAICLAALKMRLASQIIRRMSFTDTDAQAKIEGIYDSVAVGCLKRMLPKADKKNDVVEEELTVAALDMLESIQTVSQSSASRDGQSGDSSWTAFAQILDDRLVELKVHLVSLCSMEGTGLYKLRAQAHLTVINVIERGVQRGKPSTFQSLLTSDFNFGLLLQNEIAEESVEDKFSFEHWQETKDEENCFVSLWQSIALKHLPIFESCASDRLIDQMAKTAVQVIKHGHRKNSAEYRPVQFTTNANNLELPRWRKALCSCLEQELNENKGGPKDTIDAITTMSSFPIEWFPVAFLQKAWPVVLKYIGSKDSLDSNQELSGFLKSCVEKRSDVVKPTLDSFKSDLLPYFLYQADDRKEENRNSLTAFFKAFIEHAIASQDDATRERHIKKLCQIFEDKRWQQKRPVWHLAQGTGGSWIPEQIMQYYRPCSLIIEWRAHLVEQMGALLQQMSSEEIKGRAMPPVLKLIRKHITQNDDHVDLLEVESSPYWKTNGAHEPLIALLGLHTAALEVLTRFDVDYGKEERQLDYRTLSDAAMTLYSNYRLVRDPNISTRPISNKGRRQVAFALLQVKEAGIEVSSLKGRTEVTRQAGLGSLFLSHVDNDTIFSTWLHLFSTLFYIWYDRLDGELFDMDDEVTTLVAVCRNASLQEYEDVLEVLYSALSLPGDQQHTYEVPGLDDPIETHRLCRFRGMTKTLSILLCNGPEGTLTISQRIFSRSLAAMSLCIQVEDRVNNAKGEDNRVIKDGAAIGSVHMIEAILSSRPILIRSGDVATIFAMASQVIQYKCGRDMNRSLETTIVWTSIVTSLIDLIRLRKDFVALYLPQLTLLLKQILGAFHTRYTGNFEDQFMDDEFEKECTEAATLGIDSARLFNRLLSTITTKSTSNANAGLPASKLKSLAKPFSSHAIHVIVAFVRNMTTLNVDDPTKDSSYKTITFVKGETREELKRGIYHLCDIIGSWQKMVMMDMLSDDGERILMRNLWREWEAQRYKGA